MSPSKKSPSEPEPEEPATEASPPSADAQVDPCAEETARAEALALQVSSLEDRLKRTQAEFLNETKRIRQQADADRGFAIQRVVVDLLPLADALHVASGQSAAGSAEAEGVGLIARQLDEVLQRHGVQRIDADGKPFDPAQHEALRLVERDDVPPQTVVEVLRPGFTLNGRVVRPAHVAVSRAKPASPPVPGS